MSRPHKPRVLFVCFENSCRSQMAEAFGRLHAEEEITVRSAGSRPSGRVNPTAIRVMEELGYDLTTHRSKGIEDLPAAPYDVVVSMGCGDECPHVPARARAEWTIADPKDMPLEEFRAVRDEIEREVIGLVTRLREPRGEAAVEGGETG